MAGLRKREPRVSKEFQAGVEVTVAAWLDLLGYGALIAYSRFNPLKKTATMAIERLRAFHDCVSRHAVRHFEIFSFNDGAVAYRDLSLRTHSTAADFLLRSFDLHGALNEMEFKAGHPGARMVIACGLRVRGPQRAQRRDGHAESIRQRYRDGLLPAAQAIEEALQSMPYSGLAPALMANFAFSKAFLADQAGSAAGLSGPRCFVEMALFERGPMPWIQLGQTINWRTQGMSADFSPILSIDRKAAGRLKYPGLRDGIAVGQAITDDPEVLDALRKTVKN